MIICLEVIHETGVTVVSVTFDGTATNFATCNKLGANLNNITKLQTHFPHPITHENVYIFLDICHMFNLIRNCFGTFKKFKTNEMAIIDWTFIEKLCNKQESDGLHAATRLRRRHLLWAKEKMKVSLAVQTLSKSVADALDFLNKDVQDEQFSNSEGTAKFCRLLNNVFDIFNSRNVLTKNPFENRYIDYLNEFTTYIKNEI